MKSNKNEKLIILFTSIILLALSISTTSVQDLKYTNDNNNERQNLHPSVISGPISINGHAGWATAKASGDCSGEGTFIDPYVIEDLVIEGTGGAAGISISNSHVYFKIENCTIFGFSSGISLYYANNGTLVGNNCTNNYYGIVTNWCDNNTITGNHASFNSNSGIFLDNSLNSIVRGNTVRNNTEIGLYIQNSNNNLMYENYAMDNGFANGWDDEFDNQWDNGQIGNFWSDYTGVDANDDGIGDTPYTITGSEVVQDNFPIWDDGPEFKIPGYNFFVLFGIIPVIIIFVSKRTKK